MGEARMVPADIAFLEDLGGACCSADRNRFGDFLLEGKTTDISFAQGSRITDGAIWLDFEPAGS